MTELSAATDRTRLAGSAYSSARDLAARQSLYQWQTPRHDLPRIVAEKLTGVRGGGRVVDVGCGNAKYVQRLREDRPDLAVLGLDISPGILATVPGPVAVADVTCLPLATGSADAVLALHMLYHVPDIALAVRELSRVVARDGVAIASSNSHRSGVGRGFLCAVVERTGVGRPGGQRKGRSTSTGPSVCSPTCESAPPAGQCERHAWT